MENRFSVDYERRKELLATIEIPKISEVKLVAGLPLALVLFEACHPDLRVIFGLEPSLEGPKGDLWQSPSDLLIGKVALKPPLTQKHIQALTHQGILDLGAAVEQKFINEIRMEREQALKNREQFLGKMYEAGKASLIETIREEERLKYDKQMEDIRHDFDSKVCQLLWECYEQVRQLEEQLQVEVDSLNVLWKERLEHELHESVGKITEEFLEKMGKQEKTLVTTFKKQIKELKGKHKCVLDLERVKCKEMVVQLKHKLHCQNIANLMYLLCKERRKCKGEKNDLENYYLDIIRQQKSNIKKKDRLINDLKKMRNEKIRQLNTREKCLIEILRQFQRFIYFALKSAPTQGEFLLNINKLIRFEIDDYDIPEDSSTKEVKEPLVKQPQDYLAAIEEHIEAAKPLTDEEPVKCSDALPAIYFNDKMYVREDFRDMFSAGISIDQRNSLWNPDVEELLHIFKQSITPKINPVGIVKSHASSVHFHPDYSDKSFSDASTISDQILSVSPDPTPYLASPPPELATPIESSKLEPVMSKPSPQSTTKSEDQPEDKELTSRKVSLAPPYAGKGASGASGKLNKTSPKPKSDDDNFDLKPANIPAMTQSRLTLARDSIILHISNVERKSLQYISKVTDQSSVSKSTDVAPSVEMSTEKEERVFGIETEEEHEENLSSGATSTHSQDTIVERESTPTSKILLATDSYELIKRSTIGLIDRSKLPAPEKPKEPEKGRKSLLTFASETTNTFLTAPLEVTTTKTTEKKTKQIKQKAQKGTMKKKFVGKVAPKPTARVVGSRKTTEHEKTIDEFTDERIKSLVNVMKENPSLIRLFTPCFK